MSMTLNPKTATITDSQTTIIEASSARDSIVICSALTSNNCFIAYETAVPEVDKGIILYAGEKLTLNGKAARYKITGICDSGETATLTIQEA